jgi:phage shock protein C
MAPRGSGLRREGLSSERNPTAETKDNAMGLVDELERLESLLARGVLTRDEFERAKELLLSGQGNIPPKPGARDYSWFDHFRCSKTDRWLGGVCGGLGEMTPIPSWAWRIAFVLFAAHFGIGIMVYILLWIFVPESE